MIPVMGTQKWAHGGTWAVSQEPHLQHRNLLLRISQRSAQARRVSHQLRAQLVNVAPPP